MEEAKSIANNIVKGNLKPLYLFFGEEPYFIDVLSNVLQQNVVPEESKAFDQLIVYGKDTPIEAIVAQAKRFPMISSKQLIIVKEAQHLARQLDQLVTYANTPLETTVLVLCYKYNKLDKRKAVYKAFQKNGIVLESKKLYENKIPGWIHNYVKQQGYTITPHASHLLFEFLGTDLGRIAKEVAKLSIVIPKGIEITPDHIEQYIGISKEYNNFELKKAIAEKNVGKAYKIIQYFSQNTKDNPFLMTLAILHSFFTQIMQYHGLSNHNPKQVAATLGISPFFVGEIQNAARVYPMKRVSGILQILKDLDLKNKGVGTPTDQTNLLKELLIKIL